jgi:hypothetical protein
MSDDPSMDWQWQQRVEEDAEIRAEERRRVFEEFDTWQASEPFTEYLKNWGGQSASEVCRRELRRICGLEDKDE